MNTKQYRNIEDNFFKAIKKLEGNNLLLYCLTGSLGRNDLIDGWSDIDILLVFNEYSVSFFSHIGEALKDSAKTIKIGTTFYSLNEFNNAEYFKDPKTCHTIELIKKGIYVPKVKNDKIILPNINKEILKIYDLVDMGKYLHNIRRQLIERLEFDERSVYKQLFSILKILLYRQDILVFGYQDVLLKSKKYLSGFKYSLPLPKEIMNSPAQKNDRYNVYVDLLNWLKDYKLSPID